MVTVVESDSEEQVETPTGMQKKIVLHPNMLGDPAYRMVWGKILEKSLMGNMLEQLKDV